MRVITRLNVGGPARQALLLTRFLEPEYETTLVAGTPTAAEGELTDPEVEVTRLPLVRQIAPPDDIRAFNGLRGLVAHEHPKIIHSHMAKAGALARLAARGTGRNVRTVHTFHGHVFEGYFGPLIERGFIEVERRLARRTDALIAISPEIRDQLLELRIGRPEQYRVIPLGFDLTPLLGVSSPTGRLRQASGVGTNDPLIGIVGRLTAIKNHALLFSALERMPDVHCVVLGDGELRAELERLVERLRLTDRVHFLGWWLDVPSAMSDLDVVVLTSRNEGTPVSLIEALAAARPAVATDVGGVRFVVKDGASGLVVPPDDPEALAAAILRLSDDKVLRETMGARGREDVASLFGRERLLKDIRALYMELTG